VEPTAELEALPGTRAALHRLAAHVLGRRRSDVTGRFGLRPAPGGLATPAFGDAGEVVRVCGTVLVVERAGRLHAEPVTTLGRAAEAVGVDLAVPFAVGRDTPPVGDPDEPLDLRPTAVEALAAWWAFGDTLLAELVAGAVGGRAAGGGAAPPGRVVAATVPQLWPEHFDHAGTLTVTAVAGDPVEVEVGASPGDVHEAEPYLYVGPHGPERPGDAAYWNAPFGALLRRSDLLAAPPGERRARALAFLGRGLALAAGAVA
jgi:hypothetical protein